MDINKEIVPIVATSIPKIRKRRCMMELKEIEANFAEVKQAGKNNAQIVNTIDDVNLMAIAAVANFISLEIGMLIRLNIEILRRLEGGE